MLICACSKQNIHLLFVGDGDQLPSINKSKYQKTTNRGLLYDFVHKKYTLKDQMRVKCPERPKEPLIRVTHYAKYESPHTQVQAPSRTVNISVKYLQY